MLDIAAKELITQLLSKSPDARLGGSFAALKAHKYFGNLEWNDLIELKIKPPYAPRKLDPNLHVDQLSEKNADRKIKEFVQECEGLK
jgi:hypothetical protein